MRTLADKLNGLLDPVARCVRAGIIAISIPLRVP